MLDGRARSFRSDPPGRDDRARLRTSNSPPEPNNARACMSPNTIAHVWVHKRLNDVEAARDEHGGGNRSNSSADKANPIAGLNRSAFPTLSACDQSMPDVPCPAGAVSSFGKTDAHDWADQAMGGAIGDDHRPGGEIPCDRGNEQREPPVLPTWRMSSIGSSVKTP
jgi:hypothetical protein